MLRIQCLPDVKKLWEHEGSGLFQGPLVAGLGKTWCFSKKTNPPVFFCFFKTRFLLFFFKETRFCSFFRKTEKPHTELFSFYHAMSPFSELHNNNLLYLLWDSNLRVKKCTPSLFSRSVVGQFTPK